MRFEKVETSTYLDSETDNYCVELNAFRQLEDVKSVFDLLPIALVTQGLSS